MGGSGTIRGITSIRVDVGCQDIVVFVLLALAAIDVRRFIVRSRRPREEKP